MLWNGTEPKNQEARSGLSLASSRSVPFHNKRDGLVLCMSLGMVSQQRLQLIEAQGVLFANQTQCQQITLGEARSCIASFLALFDLHGHVSITSW